MGALDQRPRFFEGQYLTADDLAAVVDFLHGADVRHALGAHTWGIAIGMGLVERPAPGPANRRDVILQPGHAWDGFGRSITVTQPIRVTEALFADIPYSPAVDDTTTGGKGRLVKLWMTYDEIGSRAPAPGFETCAEGDVNSRVLETFRFVVGEVPAQVDRRAPINIGGQSVDAQQALRRFDPAADLLWDTSVPQQSPPDAVRPPRWLIPLGYVRWIARQNDVGYFADRNLEPSDNADDRTRGFRRYIGVVAEYVEAAAGAIVLHRRGERPDIQHRFASLLNGGYKAADLLRDLVWVEGNLRVEGDVKIAGGQVLFRDGYGLDQRTPLYFARYGDDPPLPADGNRELRAVIGPDSQKNNRFVIGPEQPGASPPTIAPDLVVLSSGDVGIGRVDPQTRLNVVGQRIRLQDTANDLTAKRIELRTNDAAVDLQSTTHSLFIRSSGPAPNNNNVVINPLPGDGNVGVGTSTPAEKLHVAGRFIRVDGIGNEQAYIGGDGSVPLDVQIGSFNKSVDQVHLWNMNVAPVPGWMDLHCRHLFEESDVSAKRNIKPLSDALARITALRGVSFEWNNLQTEGSPRRLGLIAQEVEAIVPEVVAHARGGSAVSYAGLIPLLIEAVKELKAEVDGLREQVSAKSDAGAKSKAAAATQPVAKSKASPRRRSVGS